MHRLAETNISYIQNGATALVTACFRGLKSLALWLLRRGAADAGLLVSIPLLVHRSYKGSITFVMISITMAASTTPVCMASGLSSSKNVRRPSMLDLNEREPMSVHGILRKFSRCFTDKNYFTR
jgi:hypothetical protein